MTDQSPAIEQVLADFAEEVQVLRRRGHALQARTMEAVIDTIRSAEPMPALLMWLNEQEARIWSGWSLDRLRGTFPQLEAQNLAKLDGEGRRARRLYRRIGLPERARDVAAYGAGRRGEHASA